MCDVTRILGKIESGDPQAAEQLLPLVYEELRKLAAGKMAQEKPDQTLQATALVHEAYIRLVDVETAQHWDSRGHFFGAAAEAMRRILVEHARAKGRHRRGGGMERVDLDSECAIAESSQFDLLAVDEALTRLATEEPMKAQLVTLRFFGGLSMPEAARSWGCPWPPRNAIGPLPSPGYLRHFQKIRPKPFARKSHARDEGLEIYLSHCLIEADVAHLRWEIPAKLPKPPGVTGHEYTVTPRRHLLRCLAEEFTC